MDDGESGGEADNHADEGGACGQTRIELLPIGDITDDVALSFLHRAGCRPDVELAAKRRCLSQETEEEVRKDFHDAQVQHAREQLEIVVAAEPTYPDDDDYMGDGKYRGPGEELNLLDQRILVAQAKARAHLLQLDLDIVRAERQLAVHLIDMDIAVLEEKVRAGKRAARAFIAAAERMAARPLSCTLEALRKSAPGGRPLSAMERLAAKLIAPRRNARSYEYFRRLLQADGFIPLFQRAAAARSGRARFARGRIAALESAAPDGAPPSAMERVACTLFGSLSRIHSVHAGNTKNALVRDGFVAVATPTTSMPSYAPTSLPGF